MIITRLTRQFKYKDLIFEDPNPNMTTQDVKNLLSINHPELTNAVIVGPEINDGVETYTFSLKIGTKG